MFREDESHALYLLKQEGVARLDVLNFISHGITKDGRRRRGRRRARARRAGEDDEDGAVPREEPARGLHHQPQRGGARRAASIR